jgi:hypothetical protein
MKKTPFGKIRKKLIPVFPHTDGGMVYLISTGYPDPNIYPEDIQEAERNAGTVQYLLNMAAIRLSEKIGCTPIEAKRKFAPQIRQYKYEEYLDEHGITILKELLGQASDRLSRQEKLSQDEARSRLGDPLMQDTEIVYDYTMELNESELTKLFENMPTSNQRDEEIKRAVTLTMRHRVAKAVKVTSVTESSVCIDAWFDIAEGDRILIGKQVVTVQSYDRESEEITLKGFGSISSIKEGSTIFFVSPNNEYLHGWDDWEEEDSLALKAIALEDGTSAYEAVYNFFLSEISGGARQEGVIHEEETDLGESNGKSLNTSPPLQLIGANSTGG